MIALDSAILFATLLGCILFGLFTILFATTMYILIYKRKRFQRLNKPIIMVSVAMYTVALLHIIFAIHRTALGFLHFRDEPGGPTAYFIRSANALYLIKTGLYILQTIIGDAFVIYRLYIVWSGNKLLLVPALICLSGSIVCGTCSLIYADRASPTTPIFVATTKHWIASFFSLTLFTNFSCTGLIALKIWMTERSTSGFIRTRSLSPVMVIMVESGAIYSTSLISLLATYLSGSWAQYIVLDMVVQIIGIVFSLIIVRIGLGLSSDETTYKTRVTTTNRGQSANQSNDHALKHVAVRITEQAFVRDDDGKSLERAYDKGIEESYGNSSSTTVAKAEEETGLRSGESYVVHAV